MCYSQTVIKKDTFFQYKRGMYPNNTDVPTSS